MENLEAQGYHMDLKIICGKVKNLELPHEISF